MSQASVASSAFEFTHQHGHRYHRKDEALLPNDETEQDRLDFQHHIFKMLLDGALTYTVLPNNKPLQIIDVGCGTGIWAIEMGDALPKSTIRGIEYVLSRFHFSRLFLLHCDLIFRICKLSNPACPTSCILLQDISFPIPSSLTTNTNISSHHSESPIQPHWVPPNVQFEIDDVTKPWLTKASSIDFIHIRTMAGCIPSWPTLLRSSLRALKPGGSIEVTDIMWHFECQDGSMAPDCASVKWADQFHELASAIFHVDFGPSPRMAGWLEEVGFEDVEVQTKIVPVGPWPKDKRLKEIGLCFLSQMLEGGMENYSMGLFTKAGWGATEVHAMLGLVRSEITNPKVHSFTRAWFITGRKKESSDGAATP